MSAEAIILGAILGSTCLLPGYFCITNSYLNSINETNTRELYAINTLHTDLINLKSTLEMIRTNN